MVLKSPFIAHVQNRPSAGLLHPAPRSRTRLAPMHEAIKTKALLSVSVATGRVWGGSVGVSTMQFTRFLALRAC